MTRAPLENRDQDGREGRARAVPKRLGVAGDNPIRTPADDTIGRADVARSFAKQILAVDAREGVVVGVLGAWGSGKTSFVNLAREELEQAGVQVLDFNPWMFSGAEQLMEFILRRAGRPVESPPRVRRSWPGPRGLWRGVFGNGLVAGGGPLDRARAGRNQDLGKGTAATEGVGKRRLKLQKALADLDQPIVVVLDDIDRLSTSEIRDVFRLVRLTASFPNIVYLVAFDRTRVETALAEQGVPGRDYLEIC